MAKVARDVMTQGAECIGENDTLLEAARRMARLDVGALPICGEDERLKGMLTDRDIVVKGLAAGKDPSSTRAGEFIQGEAVTIGADDSLDEALRTMAEYKVRRLPVIDGRRLVGIVSLGDLVQNLPDPKAGDLIQIISSG
jgi:CBS domain-containing protein